MLEINGVDVYYSEMQALRQASLQVKEGEIVGLVGANGAGKSTLLKTISGLMQAKSGEIKFKGQSIHRSKAYNIVDLGIAHVPEGRRLFPHMTVMENLLVGSSIKRAKVHRGETLKKIYRLFPKLEERTKQAAGTLSGGEQQMVAIARALMSQPRLLMLDETSLGLAPVVVLEIFKTLKQIRDQEGLTIMLVEQNVQHCLNLADRGYVLENGETVMEGKGQDLLRDPHLREHYLGL